MQLDPDRTLLVQVPGVVLVVCLDRELAVDSGTLVGDRQNIQGHHRHRYRDCKVEFANVYATLSLK